MSEGKEALVKIKDFFAKLPFNLMGLQLVGRRQNPSNNENYQPICFWEIPIRKWSDVFFKALRIKVGNLGGGSFFQIGGSCQDSRGQIQWLIRGES